MIAPGPGHRSGDSLFPPDAPDGGGLKSAIIFGNMNGMKTTIDAAGRVVVPKKIREAAQLEAGSELEVRIQNGVIQLEPVSAPVTFKKRGKLLVASRGKRSGRLTHEVVEETIESMRSERIRSTLGKTGP